MNRATDNGWDPALLIPEDVALHPYQQQEVDKLSAIAQSVESASVNLTTCLIMIEASRSPSQRQMHREIYWRIVERFSLDGSEPFEDEGRDLLKWGAA